MKVLKRAIKPKTYISFLYIYKTTWGTAGDICLIRESVANSQKKAKFVGHKVQLVLPISMERDTISIRTYADLSVDIPIIKVAGNIGDGHPKEHPEEWEAYEGIDEEVAITALKPWGFKLIEPND
ncbi:hypothetical protein [Mastigocoleus testarum]|uniref:Uncharacterized protein n=1 Tax=Mastigocoleus testarum BC008 TaxID=371196 RepID=A0A0V7ZP40_9CYAN|nr:hypothetical protein [Mastigocoleus testarum]KST66301.1 hypothetical protein BC008_25335 [Mastigocoleus testarum BC008]KST66622.1 hypothetical protein BC008_25860 [Mastigocoleus testarum BC008]